MDTDTCGSESHCRLAPAASRKSQSSFEWGKAFSSSQFSRETNHPNGINHIVCETERKKDRKSKRRETNTCKSSCSEAVWSWRDPNAFWIIVFNATTPAALVVSCLPSFRHICPRLIQWTSRRLQIKRAGLNFYVVTTKWFLSFLSCTLQRNTWAMNS